MCIVFMCISDNPKRDEFKTIIAQNRDEYFNRPTRELDWLEDDPNVISGIDLHPGKEGGTWLGISRAGKIGILTNYRQNPMLQKGQEGRGQLVADYLKSQKKPREYLENVKKNGKKYDGFNLILGNILEGECNMNFNYYCNKEHEPFKELKPGIYGLSNRYLDFGWKKVVVGKERFEKIIKGEGLLKEKIEKILELMQDKTRYEVDDLFRGPEDGHIPETILQCFTSISVFIEELNYGTRTNSIIVVDAEDNATFIERTMVEPVDISNIQWKTSKFQFKIEPQVPSVSTL